MEYSLRLKLKNGQNELFHMHFDEMPTAPAKPIYFDNAATSLPKPPAVGRAMLHALNTFGGAGRGGHPAALEASRCVCKTRAAIAELFGGTIERTVFTANATESLNLAINGLLKPGDHVITTALEHNSVLRPLYRLREKGVKLDIIPADDKGNLDYSRFEKSLRPDTRAVVCTHASNLTGSIVDIEFITAFCRKNKLLSILDAAQTAGIFPVNMKQMQIDVLVFTGHKGLMGPQGTGGLCIGEEIAIAPLKVGGSGTDSFGERHPEALPEGLEAGTSNAHSIAGLEAGIAYIRDTGIETIRNRELKLTRMFIDGIRKIPNIKIYGEQRQPHAPIVSLNLGDLGSGEVSDQLAEHYHICVRPGAHCAPLLHQALGTTEQGAVRFSFSFFNTEAEIQTAIKALAEIAGTCT